MFGGYSSGFDEAGESSKRKSSWKDDVISKKVKVSQFDEPSRMPARSSYVDRYEKEEKKNHFADFLSMNAYSRHRKLVSDYLKYYGGKIEEFQRSSENDKTDYDVIKENHRFLWDDDEEENESWEKKLSKRYYDKLFKEYAICDLSRYKENKIAMRWRIEKEVHEGKGQFSCAGKKCVEVNHLKTWEVNFGYIENDEKKNSLVKLRLCSDCSFKLNFHHKHKRLKLKKQKKSKSKKKHKKHGKKKKQTTSSDDDDSCEDNKSDDGEKDMKDTEKERKENSDHKDIWKKPVEIEKEKSRDDEFDDYFEDLFM